MRKKAVDEYYKHCEKEMTNKPISEIEKESLQMFAKETDHFAGVLGIPKTKPKKERPFVTKQMIDKAKKKLKKLQKRQRKQDAQGVISVETYVSEHQALIKKLGEVMLDCVKDIYGTPCLIKPTTKINDHDGVKDFKHRTDKILNVDKDRQYR